MMSLLPVITPTFARISAKRGYSVEVWPCNRSCHHYEEKYPCGREIKNGVLIRRVWRPPFKQHSNLGRMIDALWVMAVWKLRFFTLFGSRPDLLVIGTDPIFSLLLVPLFRLLHPKVKVVHWCFDLYPEYPVAAGMVRENHWAVRALGALMEKAYGACDLVADLGPCMRRQLEKYPAKSRATLPPWALEEPPSPLSFDPAERKELFGDSRLGLLYSGNFGLPHAFELSLALARRLKSQSTTLTYSAHGSRIEELKGALTPKDTNIRFVSFVPPDRLAARLSAPDVHVVSLRPEWAGLVVPSKFFGVLAVGRPVLFEGDGGSSIAQWIKEHQVGWILRPDNLEEVAGDLVRFSVDDARKAAMFKHCNSVYQAYFSKKSVMDRWDKELKNIIG